MKIIDHNGRLFGKISIVDVLVICVVLVMAVALVVRNAKSEDTITSNEKEYIPITCKMWVRGVRNYVGDAIRVGDAVYEQGRETGGAIGVITDIEVQPGYTQAELHNGTIVNAPMEDSVNLVITVSCEGIMEDGHYKINEIYELGINASRPMCTKYVGFTATVLDLY